MRLELRTCARRGHVLYEPDEPPARERVHAGGPDGDLWQCLRCAVFVPASEKSPLGSGPVADIPLVPRGKELRALVLMRLLAVERWVRGLIVVLLGVGAWRFHSAQGQLRQGFDRLAPHLRPISSWMGVDLEHAGVTQAARQLLHLQPKVVLLAAAALLCYGALQLVEGTGLWLGRRWGEYVAVVATSLFLPLEVHEILSGASPLRVGALLVNIAAVAWLIWNGRLFGTRGGHHAYLAARQGQAVLDPAEFGPVDEAGAAPGEVGHPARRTNASRPTR
ncbi:MAG: DUF2127 domain-containing protein [Nocardioidaceae bacterium]